MARLLLGRPFLSQKGKISDHGGTISRHNMFSVRIFIQYDGAKWVDVVVVVWCSGAHIIKMKISALTGFRNAMCVRISMGQMDP